MALDENIENTLVNRYFLFIIIILVWKKPSAA